MGLPPEKYSYKVIGIIMATLIDKLNLHDVSKTMFLTMFARAKETQRERPLFRDLKAVEIQKKLEASCETFSYDWKMETGVIIRTVIIDSYVRRFIRTNPNALCINIGCGLDTRFFRINNGEIKWYDIDLPEVIALRKQLLEDHRQVKMLGCNILSKEWITKIETENRPILIILEGVLMYFDKKDVKIILDTLCEGFPKSTMIAELLSSKIVGNTSMTKSIENTGAIYEFGVNSGKELEQINSHIRFMEEKNLADYMYLKKSVYRLLSKVSFIRNLSNRIALFAINSTE